MSTKYRWLFSATDERDETHYLAEDEFTGTSSEAHLEAERLANLWEGKMGGLILRLELERRGPAQPHMQATSGPTDGHKNQDGASGQLAPDAHVSRHKDFGL